MKDGYVLVDADTHVLEPPDLWDNYLEKRYQDRPLRVGRVDEGDQIIIAGQPSRLAAHALAFTNGMGKTVSQTSRENYHDNADLGTRNGAERYEHTRQTGVDYMVTLPSLALVWTSEVSDPDLLIAYCRAYNRWLVEYSADSKGSAVPIATITLEDPHAAAVEVERAINDGCKGVWIPHTTPSFRSHGNPDFDPFWAKVQDMDVPVIMHPAMERPEMSLHRRWGDLGAKDSVAGFGRWYLSVVSVQTSQMALANLFQWALFDRFPNLRFAMIEAAAGWLPYMVHKMEAALDTSDGEALDLKERPTYYFKKNVFIAADADEPGYEWLVETVGADQLFWGSDYPHFDHTANWMEMVFQRTSRLAEEDRRKVLGLNALKFWNLPVPAGAELAGAGR